MRDVLASLSRDALARMDGFVNAVTGFGTSRDKTTYGRIAQPIIVEDAELSALYHGNDIAARMVDIVPQEMFREGFSVETDNEALDSIVAEKLDNLNALERLGEASRWERLFAGSALLLGADDGRDASRPLRPEAARDLTYLYAIDRRLLWPNTYYNEPGHPRLGQPETYFVTTETATMSSAAVVHESRLVLFRGAPAASRERITNSSWGVSVLQRAYEVLRQFDAAWKAIEILLTDGNQAVFKLSGLADMIGAADGLDRVQKRARIVDMYRSVLRAIVVDAGSETDNAESFERQSVSFSDIPQTLDKIMLRMSAAVQIPVTILMGQSPAGLSATGESDLRWFYDRIRSEQNISMAPKIRRVVDVWLRTKAGQEAAAKAKVERRELDGAYYPKSITIDFPSLWTPTPKEEAERDKLVAEADQIRIQSQVFTPDEVALKRGRPGGNVGDVVLTDEAIKARETALNGDLADLAAGRPEPAAVTASTDQTTPSDQTDPTDANPFPPTADAPSGA